MSVADHNVPLPKTLTPQEVAENSARLQELTARLVTALSNRPADRPELEGPGHDFYSKAYSAWVSTLATHPEKIYSQQMELWQQTMKNVWTAQQQAMAAMAPDMAGNPASESSNTRVRDRRFSSPHWESNGWFRFLRDQYLTNSQAVKKMIAELDNLSDQDRQRVEFFTGQIVDMYAPTNYYSTNPEAIERAYSTQGTSLLDGLENLVRDLEANDGRVAVTLSDPSAFEVGGNIATSPGKVVYRNRMFELIQYEPTTEKVFAKPLVIIPPWINKFYILDLKPKNSFIRYAVEQGHTVFVVSWVNPDASYAATGFDDYVMEGAIEAVDTVRKITRQSSVNAIGYCIGGTLLATALAWMAGQEKYKGAVANATFFTTLLDFQDPGEISVFLDDDFFNGLEQEVDKQGYLSAFFMARTFSYMRANDLVYGPGVKSYLLGEAPPAFDLLYWNGDSTNLPADMAKQYLRRLYRGNELSAGTFSVGDDQIAISDIDIPVMAIATRTDHIAPWTASFSGISKMSGDVQLILSDSGHIAGIINPPEANKYGYWTNEAKFDPAGADAWFSDAQRHEGSWWPVWTEWMSARSGNRIKARKPGTKAYPALADAPGEYVKVKS